MKYRVIPFPNSGTLLFYWHFFVEPTGSTTPKISGDGLNKKMANYQRDIVLLCDAQSFPAPTKRSGGTFFVLFSEPTGFVKPQLASHIIDIRATELNKTAIAFCPVQSFPVPLYR